jgi:hypothetical protein
MSFSHRFCVVICSICLWSAVFAADKQSSQEPARAAGQLQSLLPQQFGGWEMQGAPHTSIDPLAADPTNAAVLKEYRFTDLASSIYTRDDGRTLKIRAARFADASGAFGAYTFYLQPGMAKEQIDDQGASMGERVLFYRGNVLIDAQFSKESVMSVAQLRELASVLPRPSGNTGNLPSFLEFMPHRGYVANTQKYVMGPTALAAQQPPVSADLVDFNTSSEVSLAQYNTSSGEATLMLISYPTPQLAAEHLRRIEAAHPAGQPAAEYSAAFFDKRTGPIIAVASGPISASDAKSLLGMVNWEASVTWNQETGSAQAKDLYTLILNIVILCGILAGLAIVAGVAFGGVRILMKRYYPDKVFDRPEQMEFISLHLTETAVKGASPSASDGAHPAP